MDEECHAAWGGKQDKKKGIRLASGLTPLFCLAERVGFEPTKGYKPLLVFKTSAFNRSATSPVFSNFELGTLRSGIALSFMLSGIALSFMLLR